MTQSAVPTRARNEELAERLLWKFRAAIQSVPESTVPHENGRWERVLMRMRKNTMDKYVKEWLTVQVLEDTQRQESHRRVMTALTEGIDDGTIAFDSYDDLLLVKCIVWSDFAFFPAMVEHFVGTGEFVQVMSSIQEQVLLTTTGIVASGPDDSKGLVPFRVMMMRLYSHDIFRAQSHAAEGADDEPTQLPLAVRMGLSGFYEDISDADISWDWAIRSSGLYDPADQDKILASFNKMTARQSSTAINAVGEESW